ncbi:MAG: laccase domain-containing protein [Planctomycetota bacterium]
MSCSAAARSQSQALGPALIGPTDNTARAGIHFQLVAAGVQAENIEIAGVCTLCRNDLFYSWRREGAGCGHFGLLAALA